jgi:hypothetical protein
VLWVLHGVKIKTNKKRGGKMPTSETITVFQKIASATGWSPLAVEIGFVVLCKWQLNVRRLYDPIDAENKMAEMEEKIRRVLRSGPKTERELKQRTNYTRVGIWFFEKAKENLKRNKEIRCFGSKRKRVKWELDQ